MPTEPNLHLTRWPDGRWHAWTPEGGMIAQGTDAASCLRWLTERHTPLAARGLDDEETDA